MKFKLAPGLTIDTEDDRIQKQGLRVAVISESGGGKSHTIALIAEQAKQQGLQLVFFDTHGEYWTFSEIFEDVLVIGGENGDLPLSEHAVEVYAEAYAKGKSLDISFKEIFTDEDLYSRVAEKLLRALWKVQVNDPRPSLWILEEAQLLCPQEKSFDVLRRVQLVKNIATGGRKFGLSFLLSTQRPAEIHKTPLSQCWIRFFGKVTEPLDKKALAPLMKPLSPDNLGHLKTGEFYTYGWYKNPQLYYIEPKRITRDGGQTILLQPIQRKATGEQLSISAFKKLVEEKLKKAAEEKTEIASLKGQLTSLKGTIEQLQRKADVAAVIRESLTLPLPAREGKVEAASLSPELMTRLENLATVEAEKKELEARVQNYAARLRFVQDGVLKLRDGLQFFLSGDLGLMTPAEKVESVVGPVTIPLNPADPNGDEAWQNLWLGKLKEAPRKLLKFLIEHKGQEFTRQQLATQTGYAAAGGSYQTALSTLRRNNLIREREQKVRLA